MSCAYGGIMDGADLQYNHESLEGVFAAQLKRLKATLPAELTCAACGATDAGPDAAGTALKACL